MVYKRQIIRATGHSQGGTSLLRSLLDGRKGLLVYPVEPSFERISQRLHSYENWEHMILDFLFCAKNDLHTFGWEKYDRSVSKQKTAPPLKVLQAHMEEFIAEDCPFEPAKELPEDDFPAREFALAYLKEVLKAKDDDCSVTLQNLVEVSFEALSKAFEAVGHSPEFPAEIFLFKSPMSVIRPDKLDWFTRNIDNSKVIFIRRNPFARLQSRLQYLDRYRKSTSEKEINASLIFRIKLMRSVARDHVRASQIPESDKILVIWYEDLARNPKEVLDKISHFISAPPDPKEPALTTLGVEAKIQQNRTGEKTVSVTAIDKWRKKLSLTEKALMCVFLGIYSLANLCSCKKIMGADYYT